GVLNSAGALVSLSVKSKVGDSLRESLVTRGASDPLSEKNRYSSHAGWNSRRPPPASVMTGRTASTSQLQVLRNHTVGRRCNSAGSGPRLYAVTRISVSRGPALAYSTNTSK